MTPKAQRIAIAKAIGFSWYPYGKDSAQLLYPECGYLPVGWTKPEKGRIIWPLNGKPVDESIGELLAQIPFDTDLNACHEMEKTLTGEQKAQYIRELAESSAEYFSLCTASQRCEAFLKTLNLWNDNL